MSWRRDIIRDLNRIANAPCDCENNGDLCLRCDAREQLSRIRTNMTTSQRVAWTNTGANNLSTRDPRHVAYEALKYLRESLTEFDGRTR